MTDDRPAGNVRGRLARSRAVAEDRHPPAHGAELSRAALLAEVRERRADTARLEWLVAEGYLPVRLWSDGAWTFDDDATDAPTWRDAVDAAIGRARLEGDRR